MVGVHESGVGPSAPVSREMARGPAECVLTASRRLGESVKETLEASPLTSAADYVAPLFPDLEATTPPAFRFIDPLVPAKLALYGGMMVPPGYIEEVGPEAFASSPVGTGAFTFVERVKDDHLTLAANADYWAGAPKLGQLVFRFIPDASARIAALLSGQADLIDKVPAINTGAIEGIAIDRAGRTVRFNDVPVRAHRGIG